MLYIQCYVKHLHVQDHMQDLAFRAPCDTNHTFTGNYKLNVYYAIGNIWDELLFDIGKIKLCF